MERGLEHKVDTLARCLAVVTGTLLETMLESGLLERGQVRDMADRLDDIDSIRRMVPPAQEIMAEFAAITRRTALDE